MCSHLGAPSPGLADHLFAAVTFGSQLHVGKWATSLSPKYEHPVWAYWLNAMLPGAIFWQFGMKKTAVAIFLIVSTLTSVAVELSDESPLLAVVLWFVLNGVSLLAFVIRAREHLERP